MRENQRHTETGSAIYDKITKWCSSMLDMQWTFDYCLIANLPTSFVRKDF